MAVKAPVRVGLIGCGGNQRGAHIPRLKPLVEAGDASLVACCDPVEENLALVAEAVPGIRTYASHTALLESEALDAVVISTPHTLHHRHILDSFDAGLHVLTEKPMVCSVSEAEDVLARRNATGLVLEVAYQRHFSGSYRWVREAIRSGRAGQVRFVNAWQCQAWRSGQLKKGNSWRLEPGLSGGGQLNDSGSHLVDILLWITDLQPRGVTAVIDHRDCDVDILSAVSVRCDGGAILNLSIVGDSVRQFDEEVILWCDQMTIHLGGSGGTAVRVHHAEAPGKAVEVPVEERPNSGDPDRNFIEVLLGRAENQVPGECGLKVMQLTEAAWEAGRSATMVPIDGVATS